MKKRSPYPPRLPPREAKTIAKKEAYSHVWVNPNSMIKLFSEDAWNRGPCLLSTCIKLVDLRAKNFGIPRSICAQ